MKKLIITAHPNPKGFTHSIAERFIAVSQQHDHECFLMNLYSDERKQDYLTLGEDNKPLPDAKRVAVQDKIAWADELVFIFPLWNFDAPAVMKNWVDTNFSSGFAYRYKPGSLLPHRFLTGKSARILLTAGSSSWVIRTLGFGLFLIWAIARLFYVGINLKSYTVFGKVPVRKSHEEREEMLANVARIAKK